MPGYNLDDAVNCGYRQTYLILMDFALTTQETIILTPLLLDERVISTGGPVDGLGPRIIKVKIYTFFSNASIIELTVWYEKSLIKYL